MMKTEKEYVKDNGSLCPVCGDTDIEGTLIDKEEIFYFQGMLCNNCGASWNDVLKLVGMSNLEHDKLVVAVMHGGEVLKKGIVLDCRRDIHVIPLSIDGLPDSDRLYLEDQFGFRYARKLPDVGDNAVFIKL